MRQGLWEAIHESVCCIRAHASSLTFYLFCIFLFSLPNMKNVKFLTLGGNIKQNMFLALQQHLNVVDSASPENQTSWRSFLILGRDSHTGLLDLPCTVFYDFIFILRYNLHIVNV